MFDRSKLRRYQQLAALLVKYGRRDFIDAAGAELGEELHTRAVEDGAMPSPADLAEDLAALGPTFVKLAQMLSTRADLLSPPFLDALASLQDDVPAFEFDSVRRTIADELGMDVERAFARFDETPIAAASLGQVHRARLHDGREVAVKVQRPDVRAQIVEDLEIFETLARAVDRRTELGRRIGFVKLVEQFRDALLAELDYRQEARNLDFFGEQLGRFEDLLVPAAVHELCAERVLTMDYVPGRSVADITQREREEIDFQARVETLCEAYLHQILVAGCYHCDPHAGNLLLTEDGRLALIDLGMVAYLDPELRLQLLRLLITVCDGRGRETAELGLELSERTGDADVPSMVREVSDLVARRRNQGAEGRKLGRALLELAAIFARNGVRPPPEITLLGKTLLMLDEVALHLDPEFDPDTAFVGYSRHLLMAQIQGNLTPARAFSKALDTHGFATRLPRRIGTVLDDLAAGNLRLRVHALDEERLLGVLENIGNRIALGLVLAALIVGAALVMQVETELTLFGYPALAIVLFLGAAVLGFGLVISILLGNRRR